MSEFRKPHGSGARAGGGRFGKKEFGRPGQGFDRRGGSGGGRDSSRTELYRAICATCGKSCEVPFRPSGDRPVYCRDCFGGNKNAGPARNYERPRETAAPIPFRPPVVPAGNGGEDKRIEGIKMQIDLMNAKLDRLMGMITASTPKAPDPVPSVPKGKDAGAPKETPKKIVQKKKAGKKK